MERLLRNPQGFRHGYTSIIRIKEDQRTGINFGILRMKEAEEVEVSSALEKVYLLLNGRVTFIVGEETWAAERRSLFKEGPSALHLPPHHRVTLKAHVNSELAVAETLNRRLFEHKFFDPDAIVGIEHIGREDLDGTAHRIVRVVFDKRNRPEANLVLGETVNLPGRWSSFPPHHHPQPELYHYRFGAPGGYGYGELGEEVFKVRQFDTLKILDEEEHVQAAAPGCWMYYVWIIRHLPGKPYVGPQFSKSYPTATLMGSGVEASSRRESR